MKPMDDAQLDKFLAELDENFDTDWDKAHAEYNRMYRKQPVRSLHFLEAIAGASLLIGALSFLLWFLYPIYQKIVGGIR